MMIFNQRKAIQRRFDRLAVAKERARDDLDEKSFERRLGMSEKEEDGAAKVEWIDVWGEEVREIGRRVHREARRSDVSCCGLSGES